MPQKIKIIETTEYIVDIDDDTLEDAFETTYKLIASSITSTLKIVKQSHTLESYPEGRIVK